jgi:hypothetical protein
MRLLLLAAVSVLLVAATVVMFEATPPPTEGVNPGQTQAGDETHIYSLSWRSNPALNTAGVTVNDEWGDITINDTHVVKVWEHDYDHNTSKCNHSEITSSCDISQDVDNHRDLIVDHDTRTPALDHEIWYEYIFWVDATWPKPNTWLHVRSASISGT